MKIKEVVVSKGMKLSVNYQTIQANVSLKAELEGMENEVDVYNKLSEMVEKMLDMEIDKQIELLALKQPKTVTEF